MGIQDEVRKLVNSKSAAHKRLIEYVVRQLRGGRSLAAVFDDPYVTNRLSSSTAARCSRSRRSIDAAGGSEVLERMRAELEALASR